MSINLLTRSVFVHANKQLKLKFNFPPKLRNEDKKAEETEKKKEDLKKFINSELNFLYIISVSRRGAEFSSLLVVNIYFFSFNDDKANKVINSGGNIVNTEYRS